MLGLTETEVAPPSMGHIGLHTIELFRNETTTTAAKTTTTKNVVKQRSLLLYLFVAAEKIWASETALSLFGVQITS